MLSISTASDHAPFLCSFVPLFSVQHFYFQFFLFLCIVECICSVGSVLSVSLVFTRGVSFFVFFSLNFPRTTPPSLPLPPSLRVPFAWASAGVAFTASAAAAAATAVRGGGGGAIPFRLRPPGGAGGAAGRRRPADFAPTGFLFR